MTDKKAMVVSASVDIGNHLTELLRTLATQIGTTVDQVFPWYVKQQVLEGWLYLATDIIVLAVGLWFLLQYYRSADWEQDGNRYCVLVIAGGITAGLAFLFFVFGLAGSVAQILNPNYYALKVLMADMASLLAHTQ